MDHNAIFSPRVTTELMATWAGYSVASLLRLALSMVLRTSCSSLCCFYASTPFSTLTFLEQSSHFLRASHAEGCGDGSGGASAVKLFHTLCGVDWREPLPEESEAGVFGSTTALRMLAIHS